MNNEMSLVNVSLQLDDINRISVHKYNELVDMNRYILSWIIDIIKFCGEFELALHGHDEMKETNNPGISK